MQKWEYMLIRAYFGAGADVISPTGESKRYGKSEQDSIKVLNQYGALGWEITGVSDFSFGPTRWTTWTLKRLVNKPEISS